MARFLTPAWLAELDAAARAIGFSGGDGRLVLGQEVADAPDGPVAYSLVLDLDGARVVAGDAAPAADLTFVCDYATAVALARGEINAQHALMAGGLRLRGDVERFASARDALATMGDVFARVRASTEF